ncbi:MAG TPA: class I tRNA ligase family protein, partial [Oligoflexia bacterium]|nr:class I tRNA ligase family protein [Oligoflexia bacterium]
KRDVPFDAEEVSKWLPLDQYIGGVEHATMHCLYFRFFHRVLQDLGFLPKSVGREPAKNLLNQGIVYKDGAKMSKSKGNVVDPNSLIAKFGADTTRMFSLFAAPPEKTLEWSDQGVEGSFRFLGRVWRLIQPLAAELKGVPGYSGTHREIVTPEIKKLRAKAHLTIKKVTEDIDRDFHFNAAIASIMELVNEAYGVPKEKLHDVSARSVLRETCEIILRLLNPFAPHTTEELWERIGGAGLLVDQPWLSFDPHAVEAETLTIVVQVNGKLRANLFVAPGTDQKELERLASSDAKVQNFIAGKTVVKTIVVPGKLVNFVVRD